MEFLSSLGDLTRTSWFAALLRRLLCFLFGVSRSEKVWVTRTDLYRPCVRRQVVYAAELVPPQVSEYLHSSHAPSFIERRWAHPAKWVYELNEVKVNAYSGLPIATCGNLAFAEGVIGRRHPEALTRPPLPVHHYLGSRYYLANERNYFHFLTEDVANVLLLLEGGLEFDILLPGKPTFQNEIFELLGLRARVKHVPRFAWIRGGSVLTVSKAMFDWFVHPRVVQLLRRTVLDRIQSSLEDYPSHSQIYISRSRGKRRAIVNEVAVEQELHERGFSVLHMEQLSVPEQIARMRQVRLVVAPHGAGLANILWMPKSARIIELYSINWFTQCYASMSRTIGQEYAALPLRDEGGREHIDLALLFEVISR